KMAGETSNAVDQQGQRFLSPEEFGRVSGLSLATVHRYIKSGKLPYLQPAGRRGRILIPADDLTLALPLSAVSPNPTATAALPTPRPAGPAPRWTRKAYRLRSHKE